MTTRAAMIETAARAAYGYVSKDMAWQIATAVLDAVLPQITNAEQLEALPEGTKVIDNDGDVWAKNSDGGWLCMVEDGVSDIAAQLLHRFGPLTVVWQPS